MIRIVFSFFSLVCFLLPAVADGGEGKTIRVGTDENLWYPFTYQVKGRAAGLHVDIAARAFANLGYDVVFTPLPWKRCLLKAGSGEIDAVLSASYKKKRISFLHYPPDAEATEQSQYRVTQVEYVVVTHVDDPYAFYGDIHSLPHPVRAPAGYSVVDDLMEMGLRVETAEGDVNNLLKLVRDRKGVVISLRGTVDLLSKGSRFRGHFKISSHPITSKSYFLVFSKKGRFSEDERMAVWKEVARVREDETLMRGFLAGY